MEEDEFFRAGKRNLARLEIASVDFPGQSDLENIANKTKTTTRLKTLDD